jgi:SAM-dependent methyltransferase
MTKLTKTSRRPRDKTEAQRADRHALYQLSVQAPDFEIELFEERYKQLRGKKPKSLREDFCGTALLCVEWCKSHPKRTALGVDLCQDTLAWGKQHNLKPAGRDVVARVDLRHANVLDIHEPKVDVTCAMNFSYCVFKTRGALRHYFESVHQGLKKDGIFVLDLLGGTETMDVIEEERELEGETFTYIWDQAKFNPITHDFLCHIHFGFPDGSRMEKAYTYDWRLWTLPELREVLAEAGFSRVHVLWEQFEDDPEGGEDQNSTGEYKDTLKANNQESWITYIVAEA